METTAFHAISQACCWVFSHFAELFQAILFAQNRCFFRGRLREKAVLDLRSPPGAGPEGLGKVSRAVVHQVGPERRNLLA